MKKTFIEVHCWNAQKIIQTMETGNFDPEYIETEKDWYRLSRFANVPEYLLDKYAEYWDWNAICCTQQLSEQFIRDHIEHLNMFYVSANQTLSIDFVRDYQSKIDWLALSRNNHLTDDVMEEFHDKLAVYLKTPLQELLDRS